MATLSEITSDDFEPIFNKYLKEDDVRLFRADWERLFRSTCSAVDDAKLGYKLTDGDSIVGILGMIQSVREIDGQSIPFWDS